MTHKEIERQYLLTKTQQKQVLQAMKTFGCVKIHSKTLYHVVYFYMPNQQGFLRIREEGPKLVTVTRKLFQDTYADEAEVHITQESFDAIVHLLRPLIPPTWKEVKVEKYREKWSTGSFQLCNEIVIDQWPGLPPYLELDCSNEKELDRFVKAIGLGNQPYFTKGAIDVYMHTYPIKDSKILFTLPLTFATIRKVLSPHILTKEGKKLLKQLS